MAPSKTDPATSDPVEIEWQFDALDLRPVERWLAQAPLIAGRLGTGLDHLTVLAQPGRRLVDRYLDTEDWSIERAGLSLRVRHKGRHDEATLKDRRPPEASGLRRRLEVTEPLTRGIESLSDDGPVGWRVRAVTGRRPLKQVLEVRTHRRPFSLRIEEVEVAEVAIDDTTIVLGGGQRPVRLQRIEVEVQAQWSDALAPLVEELRADCVLHPASHSKFEAGLLASGVSVPSGPDLGPTTVEIDHSLGDLAFAQLRKHLLALLAHEPGTRLGEDVEELHDMRVASRRLRAGLTLFAAVLPVRAQLINEELGWLAAVLGVVRDLDVQLEQIAAWSSAPGGESLGELAELLEEERHKARQDLLAALESVRYRRLIASFTSMLQAGPSRRIVAARQPAVHAIPEMIALRHKSVAKAAKKAKATCEAEDYHRVRIRTKRLRYAFEFTAGIYPGQTEAFVRQLTKMQDALGKMQDAEVAMDQLKALALREASPLSAATVFSMGSVAERYRTERERWLAKLVAPATVLNSKAYGELVEEMERRRQAVVITPRPLRPLIEAPDADVEAVVTVEAPVRSGPRLLAAGVEPQL